MLLGKVEPQVPEVFKNTLIPRLHWFLFPVEDLRKSLETAKKILNKVKIDRQLLGVVFKIMCVGQT